MSRLIQMGSPWTCFVNWSTFYVHIGEGSWTTIVVQGILWFPVFTPGGKEYELRILQIHSMLPYRDSSDWCHLKNDPKRHQKWSVPLSLKKQSRQVTLTQTWFLTHHLNQALGVRKGRKTLNKRKMLRLTGQLRILPESLAILGSLLSKMANRS